MKKEQKINWFTDSEAHDYPAAFSYLSLIFEESECSILVNKLKETKLVNYKAKDIFRASASSLLGISNSHVEFDLKKIKNHKSLSPLLLVRDLKNSKLLIADGYHRLCAVYSLDEDAISPCKIV